jgi:hypothetical protein
MYLTDYDFGWKEPRRLYNDPPGKKDENNVLVPSDFDKAEAAMRKMERYKEDELYQLGMAQQKLAKAEPWLGKNHVLGMDILDKLENGTGTFEIPDLEFDEKGYLVVDEEAPNGWGFPKLAPVKRQNEINKSYSTYHKELRDLDNKIDDAQKILVGILTQEETISKRLIGEMTKDGDPIRNEDGSIKTPGWHYLKELEKAAQQQLKKEIDYLQPLWLKELVDAQLVVASRDRLLRRLEELGDKTYLKQSDWLKMQR